MTSNNETASLQNLWAGNIAKSMMSEGNSALLPTNVDQQLPNVAAKSTVASVVILGTLRSDDGDVAEKQTLRPFKRFRPYTKSPSKSYLKVGKLGHLKIGPLGNS